MQRMKTKRDVYLGTISILQSSLRGRSEFKAIEPPIRLSVPGVKVCLACGLGHSEAKGASEAELAAGQELVAGTGESSVFICQVDITIVPAPGAARRMRKELCGAQGSACARRGSLKAAPPTEAMSGAQQRPQPLPPRHGTVQQSSHRRGEQLHCQSPAGALHIQWGLQGWMQWSSSCASS